MSIRITDNNRIPKLLKELDYIDKHRIKIGVLGEEDSEIIMIASVNEFGCDITVTEKMRNYLHSQGLHLKKSTSKIKIPERSFMRSTFDQNEEKLLSYSKTQFKKVLKGEINGQTCLERVGEYLRSKIVKQMRDIKDPPNHPYTQKQKKNKKTGGAVNNPLINTGRLRQAVTYKVVKR